MQTQNGTNERTTSRTAQVLFVLLFTLVPLFVEDHYFNIIEAKAHALTAVCVLGDAFALVSLVKRRRDVFSCRLNLTDIAVLALGAAALLSCALSQQPRAAFWGSQGWHVGGFLLASLAVCCFFLSRRVSVTGVMRVIIYCVAAFIMLLSILHTAGVDLFALHSDINPTQYFQYKSTLGNINAHVGYVCLLFPVVWMRFLQADTRKKEILYLLLAALFLGDIALCMCDGFYLGIGFCVLFALPYLWSDARHIRRTLLLIAVFGLWLCAANMPVFAQNRAIASGIASVLLAWPAALTVALLGGVGYGAMRLFPQLLQGKKARRRGLYAAYAALLAVVAAFAIHVLTTFSDAWGNDRGEIWRIAWEYYQALDWRGKLFGIGPELLPQVYAAEESFTLPVYVAHSEPLQILLTMGALGLAAWLLLWASVLVQFVRRKLWKRQEILYVLPVLAYLAQSLINSAYAINLGMACALMACCRAMCPDSREERDVGA